MASNRECLPVGTVYCSLCGHWATFDGEKGFCEVGARRWFEEADAAGMLPNTWEAACQAMTWTLWHLVGEAECGRCADYEGVE